MPKNVSGKVGLAGNKRSHALNATKKRQQVNLQTIKIDGKKYRISANELKTIRKNVNSSTNTDAEVIEEKEAK